MKKAVILVSIVSIFTFSIYININIDYYNGIFKENLENDNQYNLKNTGYWNLTGSPIFIDDADPNYNWSKTANDNNWCSGSGTWGDPYIIENVTIDGQGSVSCITIQNSSVYFIIRNCTLYSAGWNYDAGIKLIKVNNSLLINNTFTNNDFAGILLWENCINNTIEDNMWNLEESYCLMLYQFCDNNRILNNKMKYSGGHNIYFYENNNDNIIQGNYITGTGNMLGSGSSIYLNNDCDNNIILNNNLSHNFYEAIVFSTDCDNNIINSNRITNNEYSFAILFIQYCNHNIFFNNTIEKNGLNSIDDSFGIWFYEECDNNNITQNNIVDNDYYGIYLGIGSGNNTISENICGNDITFNQEIGIYLENGDDNTIIGNVFCDNTLYGVDIDSNTDDCLIYQNFFINNGINHARDLGTNNKWNSSTIGNFWDDYTGVDDNQDGIGDTYHNFGSGIDYLPIWDDDAPNIIITEPNMNQYFRNSAPSFIVEITDAYLDNMWYSVRVFEFTVNISFTTNNTIDQTLWNSLSDGMHTISFHASDDFHHFSTENVTIIKDSINPSIKILLPLNGQIYNSTSPSFVVDIFDINLDKMWYTINSGPTRYFFTNNNTIQDWSDFANGPIIITFYANDSAGNTHSEFVIIIKDIPSPVSKDPTITIITVVFSIALVGVGIVVIYLLKTIRSLRNRLESMEKR